MAAVLARRSTAVEMATRTAEAATVRGRLCLRSVRTRTGLTLLVLLPLLWVLTAVVGDWGEPRGGHAGANLAADAGAAAAAVDAARRRGTGQEGAGADTRLATASPDLLAVFAKPRGRAAPTKTHGTAYMLEAKAPLDRAGVDDGGGGLGAPRAHNGRRVGGAASRGTAVKDVAYAEVDPRELAYRQDEGNKGANAGHNNGDGRAGADARNVDGGAVDNGDNGGGGPAVPGDQAGSAPSANRDATADDARARVLRDPDGTTVVVTMTDLGRTAHVLRIAEQYTSEAYQSVVKAVILSVQAGELALPSHLRSRPRLLVLHNSRNRRHGRWSDVLPFVETESVVLHSDGFWATPDALGCLLATWRAGDDEIVASTVYSTDVLVGGDDDGVRVQLSTPAGRAASDYANAAAGAPAAAEGGVHVAIASRLMAVPTELLRGYAHIEAQHRTDPDWLPAGNVGGWCDDVGLSVLGAKMTGRWPRPVTLSDGSIYNHAGCEDRPSGLQASMDEVERAELVTACLPQFLEVFRENSKGQRSSLQFMAAVAHPPAACPTVAPAVQFARARSAFEPGDGGPAVATVCHADAPQEPLHPSGRPFNLGIIAGEFWSYEVDKRRGGFGFAAMMLARAFAAHSSLRTTPYFLHVITPPADAANITHLHQVPLIYHDKDTKRYRAKLEALHLDMIIAIEFRVAHMKVLNLLPNVPLVIWVHDPHSHDIVQKIRSLQIPTATGWTAPRELSPAVATLRSSLRNHNKVLFALTSEYFRPFYQEAYNVTIAGGYQPPLLPYMMDVFAGTEEAALVARPDRTPRVIYIGRLDPVKRPWIFVEVARQLPHVEFVMLGSLYTTVNPIGFNYSQATAIPPNLRLAGHVEGHKKRQLIASSWILLSTAIHEGLPFSFIEALQSGVPVVATHNPENVTARFGAYVGNHKEGTGLQAVPALVEAIQRLVRDTATRVALGNAGRRWVAEWLNTDNFMAALRGLVSDAAASRFPVIGDREPTPADDVAIPVPTAAARDEATPRVALAICAVFRNEDDGLAEWIEFHRVVGVERFYLYHMDDHADRDRWREVLWPYVHTGLVRLGAQTTSYLGQKANRQSATLQGCLEAHAAEAAWIAFVDVDEYLVPTQAGVSVPMILNEFAEFTGLVLPWRTFGPVQDDEHFPPISRVTLATPFDRRDGPIPRMAGTMKVIVHTENPVAAAHCRFMQNGGFDNDGRFVHYAHNCLYNAPSPPVDVLHRAVAVPWMLPFGASPATLQLHHYFARSCSHFEERKNTRLASLQARYGNTTQPWFNSRVGVGLGSTPAEVCTTLHAFFNTSDTTMLVHAGALDEATAATRRRALPPLPDRATCAGCHSLAICVDTLGGPAECACSPGYYGNGSFCGVVHWPQAVTYPSAVVADLSYLMSPPDGNVYSSVWRSRARPPMVSGHTAELEIAFVSDVGMRGIPGVVSVLLYQPFHPGTLTALHAKARSPAHPNAASLEWVPLWTRAASGLSNDDLDRPFLELPVRTATVHTLRLTLTVTSERPVVTAFGGVAILAPLGE